ncbi:zinc finger CCCH domain-containing protein 53 isoform X1 [Rhododendron vialii]|uniref:zinc finger CCCH domain-containing protein 53 isoform X1 n=1 Tax=Rhododendron vialii TaxID=182163 RepID=UPI00265EE35F|nr:zinc finger CCCH domain-containing protein 53 isoform X1 [Rhododendron vialii]XP_058225869.1 zinc finger CCCH domain-containing protein 53 isoform X1 [Rhododendron vialii]
MDTYEATRIVLKRIQNLDPENASKIMGLLLIQDHGEKEMIRLAFGPESLVHSVVYKARKDLGLASNSPSTPLSPSSSPSPFRPLSRPSLPSPLSIPNHSWDATNSFSDYHGPADPELISPNTALSPFQKHSSMNSAALPFYTSREGDLIDEFHLENHLSFLNDGVKSPDLYNPHQDLASAAAEWGGAGAGFHRRSCSVSDLDPSYGSDVDPGFGFGWKPCLYYARGYCKNGNSCRFVHGGAAADMGSDAVVGSPEQCHELLRSKSVQQQRLAAASQLMASSSFPYSALAANKCLNLLLQQQQIDSPRGVMMGEDMLKFGRSRLDRSEFPMNGAVGMMSPGSRQIYLTFPADSTFREEDVSNYFSIYGPVQDVRIPYQQKRMFGFVTFVYPETVKLILAKGNPHFVCDARVLVKPYKEKGKVPDKYRKFQQQMERGEFSACGSPTGLDSRDAYDLNLGGRMFCDSQDLMWKSKLDERLMGLQLLDMKRPIHHRTLSTGASFPSPTNSPNFFNQVPGHPFDRSSPEALNENGSNVAMHIAADEQSEKTANGTEKEKDSLIANGTAENGNGKESPNQREESDLFPESLLEHNLPDSPFASPKATGDYSTAFSDTAAVEAAGKSIVVPLEPANNHLITSSLLPATSTLDMAPFKSCYFQVPSQGYDFRFSSSHGAIGM